MTFTEELEKLDRYESQIDNDVKDLRNFILSNDFLADRVKFEEPTLKQRRESSRHPLSFLLNRLELKTAQKKVNKPNLGRPGFPSEKSWWR
jgi:hypothetical protein